MAESPQSPASTPPTPATQPPAWRTVTNSLGTVVLLVAAFVVGTRHGWTESMAKAFGDLCLFSAGIAVGVAGKAAVQALAQGSGVAGAKAALLTDAKPGELPKE